MRSEPQGSNVTLLHRAKTPSPKPNLVPCNALEQGKQCNSEAALAPTTTLVGEDQAINRQQRKKTQTQQKEAGDRGRVVRCEGAGPLGLTSGHGT